MGIDLPAEAAISVIVWIYVLAAAINLMIGDTGARYVKQHSHPWKLIVGFVHCCKVLWRDKLGQISLAVTTLFWGAGATLQFIVLKWAESVLGLDLARAAILQAVVAVGITMGAVYAAATVSLKKAMDVLPVGIAMGVIVAGAAFYSPAVVPEGAIRLGTLNASYFLLVACAILVLIGLLAGYFVVPMNALLQHRGHVLLSAGHSIAVQNFNENLSILIMLGLLCGAGVAESGHPDGDAAVRRVRCRDDAARDAAPSIQPAAIRFSGADRRGDALMNRVHLAR